MRERCVRVNTKWRQITNKEVTNKFKKYPVEWYVPVVAPF